MVLVVISVLVKVVPVLAALIPVVVVLLGDVAAVPIVMSGGSLAVRTAFCSHASHPTSCRGSRAFSRDLGV